MTSTDLTQSVSAYMQPRKSELKENPRKSIREAKYGPTAIGDTLNCLAVPPFNASTKSIT
jgi:hypothetical protein